MTHHDGVGISVAVGIGLQTSLRHEVPLVGVGITLGREYTAVADANPTWVTAEGVGVGYDGVAVSLALGAIGAEHVDIGTSYFLGTDNTGVVGEGETIVGEEEVVVAIVVDDLWTLGCLPTVASLAAIDVDAVGGKEILLGAAPWFANLVEGKTSRGVELESSYATVPRAMDEPVLALGGDDVGGVDAIVVVVASPLAEGFIGNVLEALVRGGGGYETFVLPLTPIGVGCLGHADEGGHALIACERGAVDDDAVVDTDFAIDHTCAGSPIAKVELSIGYGFLTSVGEVLVDLVQNPSGTVIVEEDARAPSPVDEVFGHLALEVTVTLVGIAIGGVGAPHIVDAIVVDNRGVVNIGQVPTQVVIPAAY